MPHLADRPGAGGAQVHVRCGALEADGEQVKVGNWLRGTPRRLCFRVPEVGRFSCIEGREIWVDPVPDVSPLTLEVFTLGTAIGIIHYQRGEFPVHGSFVVHGDGAYGLCGPCGEGKSTMALALAGAGGALLCDDVAVIRMIGGEPRVDAESGHARLDERAARHLGISLAASNRIQGAKQKYFVSAPRHFDLGPAHLNALVLLERGVPDRRPVVERLVGVAALAGLRRNTYRSFLISVLGLDRQHLAFCAGLLSKVPVYRFQRPHRLDRLEEQVQQLLEEVIHH